MPDQLVQIVMCGSAVVGGPRSRRAPALGPISKINYFLSEISAQQILSFEAVAYVGEHREELLHDLTFMHQHGQF